MAEKKLYMCKQCKRKVRVAADVENVTCVCGHTASYQEGKIIPTKGCGCGSKKSSEQNK